MNALNIVDYFLRFLGAASFIGVLMLWKQLRIQRHAILLRPHSDRLCNQIKEAIKHAVEHTKIFNPANYVYEWELEDLKQLLDRMQRKEHLELFTPKERYALIWEHLEIGYPDIYHAILNLDCALREHNVEVNKLVITLSEELQNKLKLPEKRGERYVWFYSRIVAYAFQKILKVIETNPEIVSEKNRYELRWHGATLIVGKREDCERGLEIIKELINDKTLKENVERLQENYRKLKESFNKLIEEIEFKIVDKVSAGGIIKGKCEVCRLY